MASVNSFQRWVVEDLLFSSTKHKKKEVQTRCELVPRMPTLSRRQALLISGLPFSFIALSPPSQARERRNKKFIPLEDYMTSAEGLKYYDLVEGKGPKADNGSTVQVHFDCTYRGITAISSRESKLLAGNRSIAQAAPKPPPAMYSITEGMKVGGKRRVIVPPEVGYGSKGMNEIPMLKGIIKGPVGLTDYSYETF
ncbi:hypothetical protein QJS10_CPB11g02178 [Acorus calamus]|uniref:peptidylprolyl isomerase n=1 Tax=Acorus calamus TaxID=4465 RepID=A0AAV9DUL9_ACOCL|nr:hypothetical protein QJS10_CPB11g02178 [Acorus calamus]